MDDFTGRAVFITGGASGIGFAMAQAFGQAGARVAIGDVEQNALAAAVESLQSSGVQAMGIQVDVTSRDSLAAARDTITAEWGPLHVLCNNAGVHAPGSVFDLTFEDWDWVVGVNLGGVINGVLTFLPTMREHGEPAWIVNTASVGGLIGMGGLGPYSASKFGVVGMSEVLRTDLHGSNIGVSVLCPGTVTTNLNESGRNRPDTLANSGSPPPAQSLKGTPPEDTAQQVLAAIRASSFYITTHAEWGPIIEQRAEALQASFPPNPNEQLVEGMRSFVFNAWD